MSIPPDSAHVLRALIITDPVRARVQVISALSQAEGFIVRAATILGVCRRTLERIIASDEVLAHELVTLREARLRKHGHLPRRAAKGAA